MKFKVGDIVKHFGEPKGWAHEIISIQDDKYFKIKTIKTPEIDKRFLGGNPFIAFSRVYELIQKNHSNHPNTNLFK